MNGITGASQDAGSNAAQSLPPSSFDRLDRLDDGFAAPPPDLTRAQWLEQARASTDPAMQAYMAELVTLAGGRTDDAALNQVIDRFQALQNASTAGEVIAAERGLIDQIGTMLSRFDPIDRLLDTVQPQVAALAREAGLGETAWGSSLQNVLDTPGTLGAFREGMRAGMLAGAQDLVVGTLELAGRAIQYGADTSLSGHAGDWLRNQTGQLPGFLDAIVPSAQRGAATSQTLADMGDAIGGYIAEVAADPARLPRDIMGAIDTQWSRLEASHAAAAAQGPEAEARWWGETVGRVTFEVAATFVPVAGQAGKGARIADTAADIADTAVDAARASRAGQVIDHSFGGNTVSYSYDAQGRLSSARAQLSEVFSGLDRSAAETAAQRDVARMGQAGDHGGHAVGRRFLGDQGERAMFPQNGVPRDVVVDGELVRLRNLNSGAFARLENEMADWIRAGGEVDYRISFSDFDGVRPGQIRVSYSVTDAAGDVVFRNTQRFANEAGQTFNRVPSGAMAQYFE
ncbi:MAG: hypothetical protein SXU28_05310 [Pseudomonadota bacterium]|nr:hypothetical protein [Pseudomonadota bacterium]